MLDQAKSLPTCPACHSSRVAPILYGLVDWTPELNKELGEGRLVLGGCCVFDDDPRWHCIACNHEWACSASIGSR